MVIQVELVVSDILGSEMLLISDDGYEQLTTFAHPAVGA
jgi:hypothetical protein